MAKSSNGETRQTLLLMASDYEAREKAALENLAQARTIKPDQPKPT